MDGDRPATAIAAIRIPRTTLRNITRSNLAIFASLPDAARTCQRKPVSRHAESTQFLIGTCGRDAHRDRARRGPALLVPRPAPQCAALARERARRTPRCATA